MMKLIIFFTISIVMIACNKKESANNPYNNPTIKTIAEIGGCDNHGVCGVKMTDGTFSKAIHPVVGMEMYRLEADYREEYIDKRTWDFLKERNN